MVLATSRHGSEDYRGRDTLQKATRAGRVAGSLTAEMPFMRLTLRDRQWALVCLFIVTEVMCVNEICPTFFFLSLVHHSQRRKANLSKGYVSVGVFCFFSICLSTGMVGFLWLCFSIKNVMLICFYKLEESRI